MELAMVGRRLAGGLAAVNLLLVATAFAYLV